MKKIIAYSIVGILMASCTAMHTGAISSGPLLSVNDRYIDVAAGYTSATYFLGIGGLNKTALVYEAKRSLMMNRPLRKGEYYANYTVDFKKTVSFISYITNEVFVHADVLTSNPDTGIYLKSNKYNQPYVINYVKTGQDSFYVGENIMYRNPDEGVFDYGCYKIISFTGNNYATLKNTKKTTKNSVIYVKDLLYSMDKEKNGFRYGDSVSYKSRKAFSDKIVSGKILATSVKQVIVLEGNKTFELEYAEITKIK